MNILILYASLYGNTEKIAKAISRGFSTSNKVILKEAETAKYSDLKDIDLLITGSPTQGGKPVHSMQDFLDKLPEETIEKLQFACFDIRSDRVTDITDYAAPKMDRLLSEKGGKWLIVPEAFIVEEKEGPLRSGETERATRWAKNIITKVGTQLNHRL